MVLALMIGNSLVQGRVQRPVRGVEELLMCHLQQLSGVTHDSVSHGAIVNALDKHCSH